MRWNWCREVFFWCGRSHYFHSIMLLVAIVNWYVMYNNWYWNSWTCCIWAICRQGLKDKYEPYSIYPFNTNNSIDSITALNTRTSYDHSQHDMVPWNSVHGFDHFLLACAQDCFCPARSFDQFNFLHNNLKFILSESHLLSSRRGPAHEKHQFLQRIWRVIVLRHSNKEITDWG